MMESVAIEHGMAAAGSAGLASAAVPGVIGTGSGRGIRRWREQEQQQSHVRTPAIALTAYVREEDLRNAAEAGFDAHLAKPIVLDDLLREISRLLDQQLRR